MDLNTSLTKQHSLSWVSSRSSYPSQPGVYWFLDNADNVLYVGKAKNLKNRITSYKQLNQLSDRIRRLSKTATRLKFKVLTSELEALLTEAELIRTYQPEFNVALKDDKSPLYIHITQDSFPRVEQVRKKDLNKYKSIGKIFGPFHSAYKVKEVLKLVRPIFTWCNNPLQQISSPAEAGQVKPKKKGLLQEINRKNSSNIHSRLKHKKTSHNPCFYYHIEQCPGACVGKVSQTEYKENITNLTQFLKGKTKAVSKKLKKQMDEAVEKELFEKAAQLRDQLQMIQVITQDHYKLKPQLTGLTANDGIDGNIFLQKILTDYLYLPKNFPLSRIEGYDVSNLFGKQAAVSQVVFTNGKRDSAEYRLYNIRSLNTPNDYQMMKEAIIRRQHHPEWGIPDLIVIDGGKGQLRAALSVWIWNTPVISIAKNPDRLIIPNVNWPQEKKESETLPLKNLKYHVLQLEPTHPALKLVQQIRDESHRFSKKQHKSMREREFLE